MTDEQDYRPKHVLDNIADMVKPEILADLEAARRDVMGMHEIELAVSDVPEKQLCDETGKTLFSRYMNILSDASCYKSACATCVSCKKPKAPVQPKREATAAAAKRSPFGCVHRPCRCKAQGAMAEVVFRVRSDFGVSRSASMQVIVGIGGLQFSDFVTSS